MKAHVVAFEAGNITRFVFTTNKRREVAGASELITFLDNRWVVEELAVVFPAYQPGWRIEDEPAEVLVTGAGTAKVLVRDAGKGRELVTRVTDRALTEAPGLDVYGAVGYAFEWDDGAALGQVLAAMPGDLDAGRWSRPGPDCRFQRLSIVDECATTGLPASYDVRAAPDEPFEPRSAESKRKLEVYRGDREGEGLRRLAALAGVPAHELRDKVQSLQDAEWVGVIYADGNGLGKVFENFGELVSDPGNRVYADTLRAFTQSLDACARTALSIAASSVTTTVLPLIVGGDDIVVVCDGEVALPLTVAFLRAYEEHTQNAEAVAGPLRRASRRGGLSASAGVAVVKGHHPFGSAAGLAYELLLQAKQAKQPLGPDASALAFHVLFDSTDVRLDRLRDQGRVGNRFKVTAQPYVVSTTHPNHEWVQGRRWEDLQRRVDAILAVDDEGERLLPASQLERLRRQIPAGPEAAASELALLRPRYESLAELCVQDGLFWSVPGGSPITGLLDALDVAALGGEVSR